MSLEQTTTAPTPTPAADRSGLWALVRGRTAHGRVMVYGVRTLLKSPGLAFVATLALTLGIGLTTTMFSIVYGAMMKGLPYPDGDKIMVVAFGQGADVLVFEVTAENAKLPKRMGVSGWMKRRKEEKNYMKFLAFNEMLPIEKGMRAEFDKKTALSVLWRKRDMIYGLVGGKCKVCGTVQFPRSQVCVNPNCHAIDSQDPYAMAGLECNVMSFTADSLTYSPDPPAYYGMITFPEGGRFMADFTDSDKEQVKVGAKMRMTFRIRDNDTMRGGFKRYFWKAAPV